MDVFEPFENGLPTGVRRGLPRRTCRLCRLGSALGPASGPTVQRQKPELRAKPRVTIWPRTAGQATAAHQGASSLFSCEKYF
jgi:hypothetical protein